MKKLISKVSGKLNKSYWLKSGSYSFLSRVSTTLFGFVNFYILIRILAKEDFGVYVLFFSVANFMELIKHGFVRNPLIRFLAGSNEEEAPKIQLASLYLNAVIGLGEVLLLILCSFYLSEFWAAPQLKSLFLIYILSTIALIPINHFDIVQQAKMEFKGTFLSNFTRQLGLFLYISLIFFLGWSVKLDYLIYAQFITIVFSGFISYTFAKKHIQLSGVLDRKWILELYHYGKYTFGTNVSSTILKNVDSWMLGKFLSPAAVTIFNPAIRVSNLVEVPTDTLTSILFPQLSKRIATEGKGIAKHLYEKSVGTLTAIMLPVVIVIIILAKPIVGFIAGPGFEETVPVLQITMLYGLIIPFNRLMGITLDAIGKAKTNFNFVFRNAMINVVSNLYFIHKFGIIGAAYGTLTTYILVLIYGQFYLHKNLNVRVAGIINHFFNFYRQVFSMTINFVKKYTKKNS
jgi:lipopolysaccharide exporter